MSPTFVRALESFVIVFLAALFGQVTVGGHALTFDAAGADAVLTAVLAALGIAARRFLAVTGNGTGAVAPAATIPPADAGSGDVPPQPPTPPADGGGTTSG